MCYLGLRLEKSMFFDEKKLEKTLFLGKNGLEFKKCLCGHHVGIILMDISKAFDFLTDKLILTKL